MSFFAELKLRSAYAFGRLTGVPIEDDLSFYEAIARDAELLDFRGESDEAIEARARSLRRTIAEAADGGGAAAQLPTCLGLAAEASRRTLGLDPFDRQLVAAAALCSGKVAQLQTGEGKTLAAALAAVFCSMRDGHLHLITANDYLARRDAEWMRPIYGALGLAVASVSGADPAPERRSAYGADVVYLTARELGFDYLRDGLARSADDIVQRGYSSAIVDEADFILIDEARIPLVIAGVDRGPRPGDLGLGETSVAAEVEAADAVSLALAQSLDYEVDPEGRRVSLTLEGQAKVEAHFGVGGMETAEAAPLFARVHAALHARCLLARDVDYVVKDGLVELVDSFTGRVAEARRWPWGVQAAVEAKEGLAIGAEGRIRGSIAVQHLMWLYPRIAAMTATALPAAAEFAEVYGMGTVVVPPVRPSRRRDEPDLVFLNKASKTRAIVAEVGREHGRGRPILVGTASVRESEELAAALEAAQVPCVVLNARNDEAEARLVAAAGQRGSVTISTNMAGRGTDIRLGTGTELSELGGLYVIGTNRHESRRVDDQLRGRAGRQGDPGLTRFFLSLEDPLFERYGVRAFLPRAYREDSASMGGPIEDPALLRELSHAQATVEGQNAAIRRSLRKFSLLVEYERRYVREMRDRALLSERLPDRVEEALGAEGGPLAPSLRRAMIQPFLARIDEGWTEHLALVEDLREGLGLLRYGGREPGIEFVRIVGGAFDDWLRELESTAIRDCRAILGGGAAGPPSAAGFGLDPSSTWTYAVEDDGIHGFRDALGSLFQAR